MRSCCWRYCLEVAAGCHDSRFLRNKFVSSQIAGDGRHNCEGVTLARIAKYFGMFVTIQILIVLWIAVFSLPNYFTDQHGGVSQFATTWTLLAGCLYILSRFAERAGSAPVRWACVAVVGISAAMVLDAVVRQGTFNSEAILVPLFFLTPPLLWGAISTPAPLTLSGQTHSAHRA